MFARVGNRFWHEKFIKIQVIIEHNAREWLLIRGEHKSHLVEMANG